MDRATYYSRTKPITMKIYPTKKESQALLEKNFSLGESPPGSQDPGVYTGLKAEGCSNGQSSAVSFKEEPRENGKKPGNTYLKSLSANSGDFPKSQELELDITYISRNFSPQTRSHQYISLYCSACGYRYIAPVKCPDWRLCDHCRKRESFRLAFKYLEMIKAIPRSELRLITVTTRNVEKLSKEAVQKIRSYWIKLLDMKRYEGSIVGGLYSIEAIHPFGSWNVHLHAICQVKHRNMLPGSRKGWRASKAEKQLSLDWKKITKGKAKIVSIRNTKSPGGALRYILKDLTKYPRIDKKSSFEYLSALKSSRLLSTFGGWYHKLKDELSTRRFRCPKCSNEIWIDQYFLHDIEQELYSIRSP